MTLGSRKVQRLRITLVLGTMIGSMVAFAPAAGAAPAVPNCQVKNTATATIYKSFDGQALTDALADAAGTGETIQVKGQCVGTFTVTQNFVILKGMAGLGAPTLDGGGSGPVLTVAEDATAKVRALTITGGVADQDPQCGPGCFTGGGIRNYGQVLINGNTNVTGNTAVYGGGVFNWGFFGMADNARIQGNTASLFGGGLFACGPFAGVFDGVNVLNNTPNDVDTSC